jgi:sodium-coupled neutral amino acid transporter 10
MMLVTLAATRISYQLLLYCSQLSGRRTYESIAEQSMGKKGKVLLELCTAALNLGCIVAYLNILADILSSVAGTIIPPGAEPSRTAFITGMVLSASCMRAQKP